MSASHAPSGAVPTIDLISIGARNIARTSAPKRKRVALTRRDVLSGAVLGLAGGIASPVWPAPLPSSNEGDQLMTTAPHPMLDALHAAEPTPTLAEKLNLYGRFVGAWDLDVDHRPFNGAPVRGKGECYFGWVLNGRAVQDVWIFPSRRAHAATPTAPYGFYGSTFHWYDPAIDAWHITWFEPDRLVALRQIGRAVGSDIVQIGEQNGLTKRSRYVEITDRSFRWFGDASWDNGATWTLETEIRAQRAH